jgi:hypothetical protein
MNCASIREMQIYKTALEGWRKRSGGKFMRSLLVKSLASLREHSSAVGNPHIRTICARLGCIRACIWIPLASPLRTASMWLIVVRQARGITAL